MGKPFKILSIDGGGIRGVYPAVILSLIERRLGVKISETFDMIAGTSTGSIIAAGVALKIPASEIVRMYQEYGDEIFRKKSFLWSCPRFKKLQPLCESVYSSKNLEKILKNVFNDITLGETKVPLLLPATDIGNGSVHVFKSGYSSEFLRDKEVKIVDAVLASCSAPTFFDPHSLDNYLLADGGLWANNPALVAFVDAQKRLGAKREDIHILSIGTGHSKSMYGTNTKRRWGFLSGWERQTFINFILSLQSQSALNYLKLMLKPEQIIRIDFESDMLLPLDDTSCINDLMSKADRSFTRYTSTIKSIIALEEVINE